MKNKTTPYEPKRLPRSRLEIHPHDRDKKSPYEPVKLIRVWDKE